MNLYIFPNLAMETKIHGKLYLMSKTSPTGIMFILDIKDRQEEHMPMYTSRIEPGNFISQILTILFWLTTPYQLDKISTMLLIVVQFLTSMSISAKDLTKLEDMEKVYYF